MNDDVKKEAFELTNDNYFDIEQVVKKIAADNKLSYYDAAFVELAYGCRYP